MEDQELEGYVSIGKAASLIGVSIVTLRRWTKASDFDVSWMRTLGKHRRFSLSGIKRYLGIKDTESSEKSKLHVGYARVSSHGQSDDLVRQEVFLKEHLPENHLLISDIGSGLNYKKKGLKHLLKLIMSHKVATLTIAYKDRLLRFGSEIIFTICERFKVKVNILKSPVSSTFEEDLSQDMIALVTVFSAKLYGRRSHQNRMAKKPILS